MFDSFKPTESLTPDDWNLVFDSTGGGGRSTVLLPYIEQPVTPIRRPAAAGGSIAAKLGTWKSDSL
jgi:hypothetical protein